MLREALDYPTRPPYGGRSVIVGGLVLVVIAVFIGLVGLDPPYAYVTVVGLLPWLLVRGYYVRVVRTTIGRETPTPPRFRDVRRLGRDGLIAVCISMVYLLPGLAVIGPLAAIQILESDIPAAIANRIPEAVSVVAVSAVGILGVVALMYIIGALYVLPVAVARFAHSDRPGTAFELRTVVSGAMTEDYAFAWGVSMALQVFLLPIAYLLRLFLVGFFLQFLVAVGVRYCYGQGVGAALELEAVPAAHERSDPDAWDLEPAVRRLETSDLQERLDRDGAHTDGVTPAIWRIDDSSRRMHFRSEDTNRLEDSRSDEPDQ